MSDFFNYYMDDTIRTANFSLPHLIWLFAWVVIWVSVPLFFRHAKKQTRGIFLYALAAILIIGEALRFYMLYLNHIDSIPEIAPFYICGFMVYVTIAAIITRKRLLMNFCYAFSFTATIFGVLTPSVVNCPPLSYNYIQGMLSHGIMFLVAVFFIVCEGFRPNIRELPKIFAVLLGVTFLFIAPLDYIFKANWFFLATAPIGTPLVFFEDLVGWPGYIGLLLLLLLIVWSIMYLPFYFIDKVQKKNPCRNRQP